MSFINVEIKARCPEPDRIRQVLMTHHADFKGTDHQTDTYFNVHHGRLKLREGNIENNLIYYERTDQAGPKASHFHLLPVTEPGKMKEILSASMGIKIVVSKKREIYYIKNVKFHIDELEGLGIFIEIEAGNVLADLSRDELQEQCEYYLQLFNVLPQDMINHSYSDMIMEKIISE